jgi:ribonuclease J
MNMYIYGYGQPGSERYILVDVGVAFPDMESSPGANLIFPDSKWISERKDRLDAIFITHAHEDHIGALGHLYCDLEAPIFARKFTAHIARLKMEEHGRDINAISIVEPITQKVSIRDFKVSFIPISHSIPESSALVIDSPIGRIIHSGDFKLDSKPGVGDPFNKKVWSNIGPVKALVCDSTNVLNNEAGKSEESVSKPIKELMERCSGMVVATTFASNIARVRTLAESGVLSGRSVVLLGAAINRMISAGLETGVIKRFPKTVNPEEALDIPRENLLLIVTGSQGERRAASAQLSRGKFKGFSLKSGDVFLFSSKTIPGNEVSVSRITNKLSEKGVDVVDESMGNYHVSGHANGPDLEQFHKLVKPEVVIPMHGEHRMLREHCKLASKNNIKNILAPNGSIVSFSGEDVRVSDFVETGRIYQDGSIYYGALDGIMRDRINMALNGLVTISLLIDENDDPLEDIWCEIRGLFEVGSSAIHLSELLEDNISNLLKFWDKNILLDDDKIEEIVRRSVKKTCLEEIGKKPEVTVVILRLS